jgi:hypothetical protein
MNINDEKEARVGRRWLFAIILIALAILGALYISSFFRQPAMKETAPLPSEIDEDDDWDDSGEMAEEATGNSSSMDEDDDE